MANKLLYKIGYYTGALHRAGKVAEADKILTEAIAKLEKLGDVPPESVKMTVASALEGKVWSSKEINLLAREFRTSVCTHTIKCPDQIILLGSYTQNEISEALPGVMKDFIVTQVSDINSQDLPFTPRF